MQDHLTTKVSRTSGEGGFLQIIIGLIIVLLIMKFLGLTVSEVVDWFKTFFADVLK
jgi:hypothetical protein